MKIYRHLDIFMYNTDVHKLQNFLLKHLFESD